MANRLLRVDTSLHGPATSASRPVADAFEATWLEAGGAPPVRRDLGASPLPYLTEAEHTAMFVPVDAQDDAQRRAQQEARVLADELFDTDVILLTAPMYNLTVPAVLKTWVDRLFTDLRLFPGYGITRPLAGRSVVVISTRGGAYGPGTPMEGWDYQQAYLHRLLVDICGLEQHDVLVELTLAPVNPQMAHLIPLSQASQANGLVLARELATQLALGDRVALSN